MVISLPGLSEEEAKDLMPDNLVMLSYRGSIAHGMYNPDSIDDKDIMAVYHGEIEHYLGFGRKEAYEKTLREWDLVCYELRKFIGLLLKSNPNVLGALWLEETDYIYRSSAFDLLKENRDWFLSKKAHKAFTGYAYSQLKKMEHSACQGYMGVKRRELVEKYGYDCKNAAHLIRLLRMGIEALKDHRLYVKRHDATQLLSIKRGEWPLKRVKEEAQRLFARSDEAYEKSTLPPEPDKDRIENLLVYILSYIIKE